MKQFDDLDKRMALLEQKLDIVLNNHLHHMEKDMAFIKKFMFGVMIVVLLEAGAIITKFGLM